MKLDMNHENYVYQIDYEDLAVSIFSKDNLPESREFELSAHEDVYNQVKEFMKSSVKMDGSNWNEEHKVFEALTFWDNTGESTTVPICGAKIGAFKTLNADEMKEVLELMDYLEKEYEEYIKGPLEPIKLNIIDSHGVSQQAVVVPMHGLDVPNHNNRIYSPDAMARAVSTHPEINFSNILGEMNHPNIQGTVNISGDIQKIMQSSSMPCFSIRADGNMK